MSRPVCRFLLRILSSAFFFGMAASAMALPEQQYCRVTSLEQDAGGGFLLLKVTASYCLRSPHIQYFSGEGGQTVMAADFAGVLCDLPARVLDPHIESIRQVCIGQIQKSPPVCRIAVEGSRIRILEAIAFQSGPGNLILRWPQWAKLSMPQGKPPANMPLPAADKSTPGQSAPIVKIDGTNPVQIEIICNQPFPYQSFRLHDPERYVIDLDSDTMPELPSLEKNPLVTGIRIGQHPEQDHHGRLVLDLADPSVQITEAATSKKNTLVLLLRAADSGPPSSAPSCAVATPPQRQLTLQTWGGIKSFRPPSVFAPSVLVTNASLLPCPKPLSQVCAFVTEQERGLSLLKGSHIVIDPGHGGSDPGAQRGSVQECDITLGIAHRLQKHLMRSGAHVFMTRMDNTTVSLADRVKMSLEFHPDVFLSVHINSLEANTSTSGIETYYYTPQSKLLAQSVHARLVEELGAPDRCVRQSRFYVINHTPLPSILAEVGFISNPEEQSKLITAEYQEKTARALTDGIALYMEKLREKPLLEESAHNQGIVNHGQIRVQPLVGGAGALHF